MARMHTVGGAGLRVPAWLVGVATVVSAACSDGGVDVGSNTTPLQNGGSGGGGLTCSISTSEIFNGGPPKDGIPALTNPTTALQGFPGTEYLRDDDRVVGVNVGDEFLAIPLGVFWWHEIVNLDIGDAQLAVTHCPLTGSSLAFIRPGGVEFGVSGLLYKNNLIMYDRSDSESLWPQMSRGARCGVEDGTELAMHPVVEMTWVGWRRLHPQTRVVSSETGFSTDYRVYPYGDYDRVNNPDLLFPLGLDLEDDHVLFTLSRRPPKERVLGIPEGDAGTAYPFGELALLGDVGVVADAGHVVFWDGPHQAAMAFSPVLDDQTLDFVSDGDRITDAQTGSVWKVDGTAVAGPLEGRTLSAVAEAYIAYWFGWFAFHPHTLLWSV